MRNAKEFPAPAQPQTHIQGPAMLCGETPHSDIEPPPLSGDRSEGLLFFRHVYIFARVFGYVYES